LVESVELLQLPYRWWIAVIRTCYQIEERYIQ
jgi:hypothetical protein